MQKYQLKAQKRTVVGRKVKKLRKQGLLPGNIYGNKIKSEAIELPLKDFKPVYKKAGETRLVELSVDQGAIHPVLIHNVQTDALSGNPVHADFYQVDLKQKIRTKVPVELVGTSPAVAQKIGLLLQTLNEVEVEALPSDLPEKLSVDVSTLSAIDQELKVTDIKLPSKVVILTDNKLGVVKVGELVSKEAEALAKEEEAAAAAAKAQTATASGATPSEAETAPSAAQTPPATEKTPPQPSASTK